MDCIQSVVEYVLDEKGIDDDYEGRIKSDAEAIIEFNDDGYDMKFVINLVDFLKLRNKLGDDYLKFLSIYNSLTEDTAKFAEFVRSFGKFVKRWDKKG